MSRPLRLEFAGALYHITSRGNGRKAIYLEESDFELLFMEVWRIERQFRVMSG